MMCRWVRRDFRTYKSLPTPLIHALNPVSGQFSLPNLKHTVNFDHSPDFNILLPVFPSYEGETNIPPLNSSSRLPNFSTIADVQNKAIHVQR